VYVSENFNFLKISLSKCDNSTVSKYFGNAAVCASADKVTSTLASLYGTAVVSIYMSNKIMNPANEEPVSNYLSDELFFNF